MIAFGAGDHRSTDVFQRIELIDSDVQKGDYDNV